MADISKITLPNGSSYDIKDATARSGLAGKAAVSHTHNYAGSASAGGVANKAIELVDYKNTNGSVKVGYAGPSLTADELVYFAAYTSKDSTDAVRIKDVSVDTVKTKLGLKSAAYSETSAFATASHTHTKSQITDFPTIPTKTSQLTNDSGFKTTDNNTTYSLSKSGSTITLTGSDGKTTSVTDSDTTYTLPAATSSTLGGVKIGSNITNSSGTISLTKANVTAALGYTPPTTNTTYGVATQSANGLMSSSDKTKLDGIATGANKTTVDSALSSTSTNPVQNKVINSALAGKAAASHTHTTQSAAATSDANASYLRQIATGTAEATTSNCANGCLYGQYS